MTLWDVDTQASVNEYEAHDKRIWSVDYSTCDPFLFVSGSDDGFIKVQCLPACMPLHISPGSKSAPPMTRPMPSPCQADATVVAALHVVNSYCTLPSVKLRLFYLNSGQQHSVRAGAAQVWSTKQAAPAVAIDMRANVCCVKYNPASAHEIAVGSADHSVHLYDLRNVSAPVHVFAGATLSMQPPP